MNRAARVRMAPGSNSICASLLGRDAGDDRYELTGEGSVNLYDNQGHNSIVLGSGDSLEGASLTLDADGTGYVVGLANGRSINVQNGSMSRTLQHGHLAV